MTVLAVAIQKGGTGKTTTTLSLGMELAHMGRRVLLIDIDPQSNLTQAVGHDPTQIEHSVYEVLLNPTYSSGFATLATNYGVDLIPANPDPGRGRADACRSLRARAAAAHGAD